MRKNRWESKLDPGSLYQVIYFLSSVCSPLHFHPRLSGTSLFPLIIFSGSQGLFLLFLQSVVMKNPASWGGRGLTYHHLQSEGDGGFHLQCSLGSKLCFRGGQIYHNFGGPGGFVNKVSHSNKLIVSWKYQDPSQSVMIQQVQHYESLRDESRYSDLLFFLRQPQVSLLSTTTHAQKLHSANVEFYLCVCAMNVQSFLFTLPCKQGMASRRMMS